MGEWAPRMWLGIGNMGMALCRRQSPAYVGASASQLQVVKRNGRPPGGAARRIPQPDWYRFDQMGSTATGFLEVFLIFTKLLPRPSALTSSLQFTA